MAKQKVMVILYRKSGIGYDISELVSTIKWGGRKGSAARSCQLKLLDDTGFHHDRAAIDVEKGDQMLLYVAGDEVFRGMFMDDTESNDPTCTVKAYDNGIYLANNTDSFQYEKKTADYIFKDVCARYNIPTGDVASCSHVIEDLTEESKKAWDTVQEALSEDFKATKIRHYVNSSKGKLSLVERKKQLVQYVLEPETNITDYTYKRSTSNTITRVKVLSSEGSVVSTKINSELEKYIGIFQDVEKADKDMTEAQIQELVQGVLDDKGGVEKSLTVTSLGVPAIISGVAVYVRIPKRNISRSFYVDEDTHTFSQNKYTMQLTLNYTDDI